MAATTGEEACSEDARPRSHIARWPLWARLLLLHAGLALFGFSIALQIQAGVGLAPWDALHVGLARRIPHLSVGVASIVVGALVQLTAWHFLKMPIGIGSAFNVVTIGLWIDWIRPHLPPPHGMGWTWGQFLFGVGLMGIATGAYIAAALGAGPRDSMALGIARKTGWPIRRVRSGCELLVLALGGILGARIGWGTLAFALLAGPSMQAGLTLFGVRR